MAFFQIFKFHFSYCVSTPGVVRGVYFIGGVCLFAIKCISEYFINAFSVENIIISTSIWKHVVDEIETPVWDHSTTLHGPKFSSQI